MDQSTKNEELELLREIAKWTRESALPTVRDRVVRLVDTDPKKRVFEAADGTRSYRALEAATGVNRAVIRQWVREWEGERIVDPEEAQPTALFSLRELAIPSAAPRTARSPAKERGK